MLTIYANLRHWSYFHCIQLVWLVQIRSQSWSGQMIPDLMNILMNKMIQGQVGCIFMIFSISSLAILASNGSYA